MYQFILNLWKLNKINETQVMVFVSKGFITQEQAEIILSTER